MGGSWLNESSRTVSGVTKKTRKLSSKRWLLADLLRFDCSIQDQRIAENEGRDEGLQGLKKLVSVVSRILNSMKLVRHYGWKTMSKFPLVPMGVLAPGSAHARPSARPPIDTSRNFPPHVSPNLSEVISKVWNPRTTFETFKTKT